MYFHVYVQYFIESCVHPILLSCPAIKSATSKVYDGILRCRSSGPTYTLHCQVSVSEQSDLLPMSSSITRVTVNCSKLLSVPVQY